MRHKHSNRQNKVKTPKIYAIDFDGTLCESNYPIILKPKMDVIEKVKKLKEDGNYIILWTCRDGIQLHHALIWCWKYNITFDAVNENLRWVIDKFGGSDPRKIYADYYIDDRSYRDFLDIKQDEELMEGVTDNDWK